MFFNELFGHLVRFGKAGFVLSSIFLSALGEARPPEIFEFMDSEGSVSWARLQNREMRVDFSPDDPHRPTSLVLRESGEELVHPGSGVEGLWLDFLNGAEVHGGTPDFIHPTTHHQEAILKTISMTDQGLSLEKSIRILPEGANLEVRYLIANQTSSPIPYRYSLMSAWNPALEGSQSWYHLPRTTEITRFDSDATLDEVRLDKEEFDEPWFCVDSPETGLSMFLVSKNPLVEWKSAHTENGYRRVETTLASGTLKAGEWIEGTYWISIVRGIGIPVSAGPNYIAGLVWSEDATSGFYRLESRLVGMPKPLKKLRVFSAVGGPGSELKVVPKYIRRSRLSNTEVVDLPLPTFNQRNGMVEVEQSIYSSSENLGYWKVALKTPEKLLASSVGLTAYDVNHIPGLEGTVRAQSVDALPPREPFSPLEVSQQVDQSEEGVETNSESAEKWWESGDIHDLTAATLTEEEEAALLAIESIR